MRPIDADELIFNLLGLISAYTSAGYYPDDFGVEDAIKAIEAMPTLTQPNEPLTPCDVCKYNPPSSGGGKPCGICPAEGRLPEGVEKNEL